MQLLNGIIGLLSHLIVLIAVIIYLGKGTSAEGVFMLVGTGIGLLTSAFYSIALPLLIAQGEYDGFQNYISTISILTILGGMSFAIGFLMLIRKIVPAITPN